jgi:hypothetical protein
MITKPRLDIQNKKVMFMIIWNPSSFYVINRLPNNTKMNSDYFVTSALIQFKQAIFPRGRVVHQKDLRFISTIAQFTQAGVQQIGSKNIACAACHTHSPYSRDLTSNDFYLFPTVKENPNGLTWVTKTSFLSPCKRFRMILMKKNWIAYFRLGYSVFLIIY